MAGDAANAAAPGPATLEPVSGQRHPRAYARAREIRKRITPVTSINPMKSDGSKAVQRDASKVLGL